MIIIGLHNAIYPTRFVHISDLDSLRAFHSECSAAQNAPSPLESTFATPSPPITQKLVAWFDLHDDRDFALCLYARDNALEFALRTHSVAEFLSGAHFLPKYLLVDSTPKLYQTLADDYLLDPKVLYIITEASQIEECALQGVDGVVFADLL